MSAASTRLFLWETEMWNRSSSLKSENIALLNAGITAAIQEIHRQLKDMGFTPEMIAAAMTDNMVRGLHDDLAARWFPEYQNYRLKQRN